ncbi:hypothetical protein [Flammeovirga aprica]|uniref:Tetratricopeptide repeat protein n=1 Tax=Flammeovirga aprica JL-4 TaxID=694437 RepID=A0A7X9RZW6_9BACT|nr:hypothetical protein [Flammeovirga aprica]NME71808.1 hypothetical protein [Flammeovirga aprica JL-4]
MKHYLLLAFSLLLINNFTLAQKVKNEKVKFNYLQYPAKPFPKAERKFKFETESTNKEKVDQMKKEYAAIVARIDKKYADELANLRRRQAAYDSSSTGSKIASNLLLGHERPSDTLVKKDPYPLPPVYPRVVDGSAKVHSKVRLEGLKETEDANITIKFTFLGMECSAPRIVGDTSEWNYEYSIKNPVKVTVTTNDGNVLYDGFVNNSDNTRTVLYGGVKDTTKLVSMWSQYREFDIRNQESYLLRSHLEAANDLLNSEFGYVVKERSIKIFMGATKKGFYPEHTEAFNNAILGYHLLESESDFTQAKENLEKAISSWETSLEEKNTGDKKAKINAKVSGGLHFNIVAAALFARDFKKVSFHSAQLKILGEGKFERQLKSVDQFIDDYKSRYDAYVKEAGVTE